MDDATLRQSVLAELDFDPSINPARIGVAAENGVVTLSGHVSTYAEKVAAERAALRVRGVRALAQEIEVRYPEDEKTSDDEIAQRALKVIAWHAFIPQGAVKVHAWNERGVAERAAWSVPGVTRVEGRLSVA